MAFLSEISNVSISGVMAATSKEIYPDPETFMMHTGDFLTYN